MALGPERVSSYTAARFLSGSSALQCPRLHAGQKVEPMIILWVPTLEARRERETASFAAPPA
jgi:hypothetical protein